MFKPKHKRNGQPQNPISDMEQFYLNQYFQSQPKPYPPYPSAPPYINQTSDRFPPVEQARFHQIEMRLARIEQYLGLTPSSTESGFQSVK